MSRRSDYYYLVLILLLCCFERVRLNIDSKKKVRKSDQQLTKKGPSNRALRVYNFRNVESANRVALVDSTRDRHWSPWISWIAKNRTFFEPINTVYLKTYLKQNSQSRRTNVIARKHKFALKKRCRDRDERDVGNPENITLRATRFPLITENKKNRGRGETLSGDVPLNRDDDAEETTSGTDLDPSPRSLVSRLWHNAVELAVGKVR